MTDPAAGKLEFPGGHIEDGERSLQAAVREWQEETGCLLPHGGTWSDGWVSPNGVYEGHVYTVASEADIPIADRAQVNNPDDPDGDEFEVIVWVAPDDLPGNPMVRAELAADIDLVLDALQPIEVAKQDPKGSWRDSADKTPQHAFDLRLTDHYAPLFTAALRAVLPETVLRDAVEAAAATVAKSADPAADALANAGRDALAAGVGSTDELEQILRQAMADAFLTGGHAAAAQVGGAAVTLAGVDQVDWANWVPGDPAAAATVEDGGLADLLARAGVTINGFVDTALDQLGNTIADGVARGATVDDVTGDLMDVLDDPARAERIAHTEIARAQTAGTMSTYAANQVSEFDIVLSDGACPVCEDAQEAGPYPVSAGGGVVPLHPCCRCSTAPKVNAEA